MLTITSSANPRFKQAMRLRDRKHRLRSGQLLIDGVRESRYAHRCGVAIETCYLPEGESTRPVELRDWIQSVGCEVVEMSQPLFDKLAYGQRASQLIALARRPQRGLESIELSASPWIAVLEGVEKPGNLGAIARTADAVGLDGLLLIDGVDADNPNAIRASMGTVFAPRVVSCTLEQAQTWIASTGFKVCAAWVDGSSLYHQVDYREPIALVLGSEADGLSPAWSGKDVQRIRLPMHGIADSLNVSTTAAVLCYEAWRQRQEG